jgi:type VI secretion system protein ImpG
LRDELLQYYERELAFLRQMGADFADKYPKVASRLLLEPDKCEDPHVERLLEAFAFLAARVHLKIDDDFPEISESLLGILYPHYLRPIPSMSVVQFAVNAAQGKMTAAARVAKGSNLLSRQVGGVPCRFTTCYETDVWPIEVTAGEWRTPDRLQPPIKALDTLGAIRIGLRCFPDVSFKSLKPDTLRFYLSGDANLVYTLYELLSNNCTQILVRDTAKDSRVKPVVIPIESLRPVGFGEDEDVLPYPRRSFIGYRLLQEYFTFPEKFFFFDVSGLSRAWESGIDKEAEIIFLISPFERVERREVLELGVSAKTFRLNCTPIVNLFRHTAEPILLSQRKPEYPIVADVRRPNTMEVYSVEEVLAIDRSTRETVTFEPFYSLRHAARQEKSKMFWSTNRRQSTKRNDDGTELYISLVDPAFRLAFPDSDAVTVKAYCSNRDLPSRLPFGNESGDFELEGSSHIQPVICLRKPTQVFRPATGKDLLWRLISHLSLNYLSLVDEGKDALQAILRLYDFSDSAHSRKQIDGMLSVSSAPGFARLISDYGIGFARGKNVQIEFDEDQFVGAGVFLFAAVLEQFLGQYVTLNSFCQLTVRTKQRKEVLRTWTPRAGRDILL